jgi:hypothetical protein
VVALALRPEPRPKARSSQRAVAREAVSLGEQSSTCRASALWRAPTRLDSAALQR